MKLICPFCGDADAAFTLDLLDGDTMTCGQCDTEFTADQARERLDELAACWAPVLDWLKLHPAHQPA